MENSSDPSLFSFPKRVVLTNKTDQKNSDKSFGARMREALKLIEVTQPEMARRLGIKYETYKKILAGEISVRRNPELIAKISREFGWSVEVIRGWLGMPRAATQVTPRNLAMTQAKKRFATALQESSNYLNFFIEVFRIAQHYKVSFAASDDAPIDKAIDEFDAIRRLGELEQAKYAELLFKLIGQIQDSR